LGGVHAESMVSRLHCFGVDGMTISQGTRTSVTKQLQTSYASFSIEVHCFAHRVNLAAKTFFANLIFLKYSILIWKMHADQENSADAKVWPSLSTF
jgi:hypothetical protein